MRRCPQCGRTEPDTSFHSSRQPYCKPCWNAYERQRRRTKLEVESPEERERRLERRRFRRHGRVGRIRERRTADEARELSRARARQYYEEHREERIAYQKARREADLEAARAYEREVYQRRRAKHQAVNRARERSMESLDAESVAYEAALRRDPCSYCGGPAGQIDHIDAVACGGRNHWTNLTAACRSCNRAKSTHSLLVFLSQSGR